MTDTFHKGEIAYYVRPGSPYYGREVEILSELHYDFWIDHMNGKGCEGMCYGVTNLHGDMAVCVSAPEWLKKKKPPAYESGQHGAGWEWYHKIPKTSEVEA